jgi:hypothetical protein
VASVTVYRLGIDLSDKAGVAAAFAREHPVVEIPLLAGVPGRLFVYRSAPRVPEWVGYLQQITRAPLGLTPAETAGAVLLLQPCSQRKTTNAVVWGTGREGQGSGRRGAKEAPRRHCGPGEESRRH